MRIRKNCRKPQCQFVESTKNNLGKQRRLGGAAFFLRKRYIDVHANGTLADNEFSVVLTEDTADHFPSVLPDDVFSGFSSASVYR